MNTNQKRSTMKTESIFTIQNINKSWVLLLTFGLLIVTLSSCTVLGTDEEEPVAEEEVLEDHNLRLTSAAPSVDDRSARFTEVAGTDLNAQRLLARTTVNISAAGETKKAVARGYAQFTARATTASMLADINWKATLLSAINLSAKTEVVVRLRVRERTPNGGNGPVIFSETLERDGIGSGLKALENLNVVDDIRESFELTLKKDQVYRIEVELECNLRVDIISFSLVDCNAGTADRGVFVNELKVSY
jgi:hypothetical protein